MQHQLSQLTDSEYCTKANYQNKRNMYIPAANNHPGGMLLAVEIQYNPRNGASAAKSGTFSIRWW